LELAKSCDYAIRGLLYLAERTNPFQPVLLRDIAERANAPEAFMSKVFQSLRASNVVRSHRGRERGYALARSPEEISLYDIIVAMKGPAALQSRRPAGPRRYGEDVFQRAWTQIEEQLVVALKNNTLQTMLLGGAEGRA
jgi:Rrf2 family protein